MSRVDKQEEGRSQFSGWGWSRILHVRIKMSTAEENRGGDSESNDVLMQKKRGHFIDISSCRTDKTSRQCVRKNNLHTSPLALLLHRKVTLRISIRSTKVLFSFKERIMISTLREKNRDSHFNKNRAALMHYVKVSYPKTC